MQHGDDAKFCGYTQVTNTDDDDDDDNNNNNTTEVKIGAATKQALRLVGGIYCYVIHCAISVKISVSLLTDPNSFMTYSALQQVDSSFQSKFPTQRHPVLLLSILLSLKSSSSCLIFFLVLSSPLSFPLPSSNNVF